jgi:uncharacterized membrane protein HdeD (DUF308 family)
LSKNIQGFGLFPLECFDDEQDNLHHQTVAGVRFNIFIMRVVLGCVFAVILTRLFYGSVAPVYVAGLAIFLVGMSYVTEYFRNKRRNNSE